MKVLIACSSSGGHINPALNFGNYLKLMNIEVTYLGFKNQIEEKMIKDDIVLVDGENSFSKNIKKITFFKLFKELRKIKQSETYDCYFGFGGFINLLLVFLKGKKPLFIHEQNTTLGDSNKVARLFSKKVFYSFKNEDKKGVLVGNPSSRKIKIKEFNYKRKLNIIFVFGSLGSKSLIKRLKEFDGKLNTNHSYTLINSLSKQNPINYKFNQIKVSEYLDSKSIYENYDLIICRGGATTLYEILKARMNAICIPSPYVKHNHQEKNVSYLRNNNLVSMILEKDFSLDCVNREINNFIDYDYCLSRYKDLENFKINEANELMYQEIKKYVKD